MHTKLLLALSPLALITASCGGAPAGDSPVQVRKIEEAFKTQELGTFDEPWAIAPLPEGQLLITEKPGKLKWLGSDGSVKVVPLPFTVDYGGQGGMGDVIASPDFAKTRRIYLSWVEKGAGDIRGAAVGTGVLVQAGGTARLDGFEVIWRQNPKVTGRGHYSHRLVISPDKQHLYIASGERQKMAPAQDPVSDLGKVIRLPIGANGRPTGPAARISMGHRNILGLQFAPDGQLWEIEHGPAGGDELNLVKPGANYGWPLVSEGRHYSGQFIPHHDTRPEFTAPALYWNPVIAPGGMIFYTGQAWPEWNGQLLIAGLGSGGLVRVRIDGEKATEEARYPLGNRIRAVAQAPDGALLVLEDGPDGRLLRLSRK